jgi:SpoVK/Ycf46/Vps4 family AAA+-type ATPase
VVIDGLAAYDGGFAVTAIASCWPLDARQAPLELIVPIPAEAERATLFKRGLACEAGLAQEAAARYRLTGGMIERASAVATIRARARGDDAVVVDDLRVSVRGLLDRELATLGRLVTSTQSWADVVLPDDIRAELAELVSRVRNRKQVLDDWGFARKVGKGIGVSALFSGPPGTGKTMVAALVAAELGLDLYQIDTSRMVSKWVGETEKNLSRLFDAAGAGHAVLLFDEADSLFAKRTEVKSSNDRYANLEVNYLLQRMESFTGISILTTNLETSLDDALRRRLAFRIAFPLPDVDERHRLWRAMLPPTAVVDGDVDFARLAHRFEMSGGYIRNAALRAAYLAAADGTSIAHRHFERAAVLEYAAMGKIVYHGQAGSSL